MFLDAVPIGSYSVFRYRWPIKDGRRFGAVVAVQDREADKSMTASSLKVGARVRLAAGDFQHLLDALAGRGYQVMGPTLEDGQLIYGEIGQVTDFPMGWTAFQEGGTFRLKKRPDQAWFGFAVGQQSWKQFLLPPHQILWQAHREGSGWRVIPQAAAVPRFAFVGVRSCELQAMAIQDRVFLKGPHVDPAYKARREQAFIVAVNCAHQDRGTCFCASMGTGPRVAAGFDLALTEVLQGDDHFFVVEPGTMRGAEVIQAAPQRPAAPEEIAAADRLVAAMAGNMGRVLDPTGIKEALYANYEHPRWDEVAARCLNCGNCTMVCPTCFCHTLEDSLDLSGAVAERRRRLDSCFSVDFSYLHGGSIRTSPKSRYRQWLTHKLATWIDQFGASGCVGCGRCITWCPVGIDLTEEVRAIRETAAGVAKE
jgi:sulfhydrogenase subunit beta (sulfur reductase)